MTEIATIDWFGRWGTSVFSENTALFLQKFYRNVPLPNIRILSKPLNLIGCHGNQKAKFVKKYKKNISEAIRGMKLKLCRNVHNISL